MKPFGNTTRILIAGFGGQGLLFLGKLLAYIGSAAGRQVTWLPSYGPEMRGGTAHCGVILSDEEIGSPIVSEPDVLIAMNLPSFQAYEPKVARGGVILLDSSLIDAPQTRKDVSYHAVPATRLAADHALDGLANMILLGLFFDRCLQTGDDAVKAALAGLLGDPKKHLIEANLEALALGRTYGKTQNPAQEKNGRDQRRAV